MTHSWEVNYLLRPEIHQVKSKLGSIFENIDPIEGSTSSGQTGLD